MNFSQALDALKAGKRVARAGGNGKGIWLALQTPHTHSKMTLPYIYIEYPEGHPAYPAGCRVPWVASQTDILAEDWSAVPSKVDPPARLCYVNGTRAYFTTQPLATQWGDDWDDAPYEHNAGEPYEWRPARGQPYTIVRVSWSAPLNTPDERWLGANTPWSVIDINCGATPWLDGAVKIWGGTTLDEFRRRIAECGGVVYDFHYCYGERDGGDAVDDAAEDDPPCDHRTECEKCGRILCKDGAERHPRELGDNKIAPPTLRR